ncbi:MAG: BrnT family toxin [Acidobacteria bacterium]|nr:BrnT family toxin [Acidobacteriota bacterium]
MDRLPGFEGEVHNVGHIALHGVLAEDVEEAARRRHIIAPAAAGSEKRWKLFGRTAAGRYLVVVFTVRRKRFRTVTAYTMNQAERRVYAPEIEA